MTPFRAAVSSLRACAACDAGAMASEAPTTPAAPKPTTAPAVRADSWEGSWAPLGWSPSVEYQDDAPFGTVLGDPLMGSLIYDVSVLDAVPGWQDEDAGTAVDPSASAEERANLARAERIKEGARRRDAAYRQSGRTSTPTTAPASSQRTSSRTAAQRTTQPTAAPTTAQSAARYLGHAGNPPKPGRYGTIQPGMYQPGVTPGPASTPQAPGASRRLPPQAWAPQPGQAHQRPGGQPFDPFRGRGEARGGFGGTGGASYGRELEEQIREVTAELNSLSWEKLKPYAFWIVILLIIFMGNVFR